MRTARDTERVDIASIGGTTARTHHNMLVDVFKGLVMSFSAACSEGLVVRSLTIYTTSKDYKNDDFSPQFIERVFENACDDHMGRILNGAPIGASVRPLRPLVNNSGQRRSIKSSKYMKKMKAADRAGLCSNELFKILEDWEEQLKAVDLEGLEL